MTVSFESVDDFYGHTLLSDAEDFEIGGTGLLRFGVAVDFDTDELGIGLPVEFGVCDIEEVSGSDYLFAWNGHQADFGWVGADFRRPVAE